MEERKNNYVRCFKPLKMTPTYESRIKIPESLSIQALDRLYSDVFDDSGRTFFQEGSKDRESTVKRLIPEDRIDFDFFDKYFQIPEKLPIMNSKLEGDSISYEKFLEEINSESATGKPEENNFGTNLVYFLSGETGDGKSALLFKTIFDIKKNYRKTIPVYISAHNDWAGNARTGNAEPKPKPLDENIYQKVFDQIKGICESKVIQGLDDSKLKINKDLAARTKLFLLIAELKKQGFQVILYFDDLDIYHYYYDKYFLFDEENIMNDSMEDIGEFANSFLVPRDKSMLANLGITVIFACRNYVMRILKRTSALNEAKAGYTHVQLAQPGYDLVLEARFSQLMDMLEEVANRSDGTQFWKEIFGNLLKAYKFMMFHAAEFENDEKLNDAAKLKKESNKETIRKLTDGDSLRNIFKLTHHGARSIVEFFRKFGGFSLVAPNAFIEELVFDLHGQSGLMVLYMLDHNRLYTQQGNHFPNLYLVDVTVTKDPAKEKLFPSAFLPHLHTYWLKYFVLKLIAAGQDSFICAQDLVVLLAEQCGYPEHLVKLCIGSLCTPNHFSCVNVDFGTPGDLYRAGLTLTTRGEFLLNKHPLSKKDASFCFSFNYLQLIVHDPLLLLPKKIFSRNLPRYDYSYFYQTEGSREKLIQVVEERKPLVLEFLSMLEASLAIEQERSPGLKEALNEAGVNLPDFEEVYDALEAEIKSLLGSIHHAPDIEAELYPEPRRARFEKYEEFFRNAYIGENEVEVRG